MKSETLSKLVRARRTALALSPVQLARKAGVNMAVVGALEGGDVRHVNVAELLKVIDCLGLQLSENASAQAQQPEPQAQVQAEESPKPVPANMKIRQATLEDASAISAMIIGLAPEFMAHPDSADAGVFLETVSSQGIAQQLSDASLRYYTGWIGDTLAGVLAIRSGQHVHHWFVRADMHKRGLGRKLWLHVKALALASGQRVSYTVNASINSVAAYERLGFEVSGEAQEKNGLRFVPMQLG